MSADRSDAIPALTLSIVSHGHGAQIAELLGDLARLHGTGALGHCEILLTLNIPEDEAFLARGAGLPMHVHRNPQRLGFGANHNAAFRRATGHSFAIVNPDIRLPSFDAAGLLHGFTDSGVGAVAPRVVDSAGLLQDSVRKFPTVTRLAWRFLTRDWRSEYPPMTTPQRVDWAAGMFLLIRREAWADIDGFDERYHMYFEDVDLCRRLGKAGWSVLYVPSVEVIHDATRATHKNAAHLKWHLRSAARFLTGF